MERFEFGVTTKLIFGADTISYLGEQAVALGAGRVMVVTDPGIIEAGHAERGLESLHRSNVKTCLFDGARENPTTAEVDSGRIIAQEFQPDMIIGLGGGSSMDCAKGINFVFSCGGTMHDYHGMGKATAPLLPMIAVPTTSGTGSEMQSFALISDAQTHVKMACGDKRAAFRVAILDPQLTLTQPPSVTALTGIDAISHAIETYVTKKRNPLSQVFSKEAWRLLSRSFLRVLSDPQDLEARSDMQLGAAYAGVAIENSMLGASHALANPLTSKFGTAHGQAVGLMLPHVIRFNGQLHNQWYRELLEVSSHHANTPTPDSGAEGLASFVESLLLAAGLSLTLEQMNVPTENLTELANSAAQQWTGTFNPRPVDQATLLHLYRGAL